MNMCSLIKSALIVVLILLSLLFIKETFQFFIIDDEYIIVSEGSSLNAERSISGIILTFKNSMESSTIFFVDQATIAGNPLRVLGIDGSYCQYKNIVMLCGRTIWDDDIAQKRRVILISSKLSIALYGSEDSLGSLIELNGSSYEIVGVYCAKTNALEALIPCNLFRERKIAVLSGKTTQPYVSVCDKLSNVTENDSAMLISLKFEKVKSMAGLLLGVMLNLLIVTPIAIVYFYRNTRNLTRNLHIITMHAETRKRNYVILVVRTVLGIAAILISISGLLSGLYVCLNMFIEFGDDLVRWITCSESIGNNVVRTCTFHPLSELYMRARKMQLLTGTALITSLLLCTICLMVKRHKCNF